MLDALDVEEEACTRDGRGEADAEAPSRSAAASRNERKVLIMRISRPVDLTRDERKPLERVK